MYDRLGKAAVGFAYRLPAASLQARDSNRIGVAGAVVAVGAYLASRNVPEG